MKKHIINLLLLFFIPLSSYAQTVVSPEAEKALWDLWQAHIAASNNHEEIYSKCAEFSAKTHYYPLTMVADGIAAWRLLKAGQQTNAVKILSKMENISPSFPLASAAATMGKTWLTRIDRERVRTALKFYYRKNVEFPVSLDALQNLPAEIRPPFKDHFGKNWSYRIVNFKYVRGFKNQKYELLSTTLGTNSDLAVSLAKPYGSEIRLKPVKLMTGTPGRETFSFERTGEKKETVFIALGSSNNNVLFAFCGQRLIILSDGNHWSIITRPK